MVGPHPTRPGLVWDEVAMVGPHPTRPDLEVLVLGTTGPEAAWQLALHLVEVYLAAAGGGGRDPAGMGLVIVDTRGDGSVRGARALHRRRG
jgi:hypothetical protein